MASTGEPEIESRHHDTNIFRQISEMLNSERVTYIQRTHGINGKCLKNHIGLKQLLAAQWQDQQHHICPMASVDMAEPHLTEPKLLVDPKGGHQNWNCDRRNTDSSLLRHVK